MFKLYLLSSLKRNHASLYCPLRVGGVLILEKRKRHDIVIKNINIQTISFSFFFSIFARFLSLYATLRFLLPFCYFQQAFWYVCLLASLLLILGFSQLLLLLQNKTVNLVDVDMFLSTIRKDRKDISNLLILLNVFLFMCSSLMTFYGCASTPVSSDQTPSQPWFMVWPRTKASSGSWSGVLREAGSLPAVTGRYPVFLNVCFIFKLMLPLIITPEWCTL